MSTFDAKVVYIYSDTPAYVRAKKTLQVLQPMFREVHFIGCHRKHQWDTNYPEGITYHIEDRVMGTGASTLTDIFGFFRYIKKTLDEIKPDIVIVVNEEYVLPFTFRIIPKHGKLVLDLYDSIGMRILGPLKKFNFLWRFLSSVAMKTVDAVVEVCQERLDWHKVLPKHSTVVYNSPNYIENLSPMTDLPCDNFIYAGGTFDDNIHGIEPLFEAINRVKDINVIVTGKPQGDFVKNVFLKHPRVHFLGVVPYEDVPRISAGSLAVFAHYNPVRLNYVYGAPNKLYEAMMVGRPVLINKENKASHFALEKNFGLVSPYGNVEALAKDIRSLIDNNANIRPDMETIRKEFKRNYSWETMAHKQWKSLISEMGF